jgi:hypothetical protein
MQRLMEVLGKFEIIFTTDCLAKLFLGKGICERENPAPLPKETYLCSDFAVRV